jgi:phosphoglycolate phosphatase
MGIRPEEFLYVGDTATDMQTTNAAAMYPLGALWGFRKAEELLAAGARALLHAPADVLNYCAPMAGLRSSHAIPCGPEPS